MAARVTGGAGSLRIASIRPAGPSKKVFPLKSVKSISNSLVFVDHPRESFNQTTACININSLTFAKTNYEDSVATAPCQI